MEVSSGYSMTRLMSDYLMPKQATVSYPVLSGGFAETNASFSENLPQTITFTANKNIRWSLLTTDQPIFNFRVRCTAMCFNWGTQRLEEVKIPLPLGAEYSIKLLFATRSDVPVTEGS